MSKVPENLKYTADHEWVLLESDSVAIVGITDYAQESLGDITFVELPSEGTSLNKGDTFGVVESVKAASDLYSPLSGEVIENNPQLDDNPESVNTDPFGEAWMIKIKISDPSEIDDLLSPEDYQKLI